MTLKGFLMRGWIVEAGDGYLLTDAGYATIGQQRPSPPPTIDDSPARDSVQPCRPGTKLAKVVAALQNRDGATIFQLMCCTGWQPHTVRGALSGMVRKKLGLNVVSTQAAGRWRAGLSHHLTGDSAKGVSSINTLCLRPNGSMAVLPVFRV